MLYSIGEAAEMVGVNPSTLRYYDKEGLLPMVERSSGGIRMFTEKDFVWLRLIGCLKATGMPIKDIKQFIDWYMEGDSTLKQRRDMFYRQKEAVEQQMAELQKTLDTVTYKCWFYDTAVKAGTASVLAHMKPEDMPEKIQELRRRSGLYQSR